MNKFVITSVPIPDEEHPSMVGALFQEDSLSGLTCYQHKKDHLNNIYIARVDSIAENIHAFFVRISRDEVCFVPYEDLKYAVFTRKLSKKELAVGDELLVQIKRLPLKTKQATATTRISLAGRYVAVSYGPSHIGVSNKISADRKADLKEYLSAHTKEFHDLDLVARTNCQNACEQDILREAVSLSDFLMNLVNMAPTKTLYSCLYNNPPRYVKDVLNSYEGEMNEVITDNPVVYEDLKRALLQDHTGNSNPGLRFYEDPYPLYNLFSLKKEIQDVLSKKVWLKSGAYLIIEPTEALTVIDVNSGKNIRRNKDEYFLDINKEAAKEIARQLRLRNISGICIVDFIDLPSEEQQDELLHFMKEQCKKDHVLTTVVDITKLHLMEITRKKTDPTFYEQIYHDFS